MVKNKTKSVFLFDKKDKIFLAFFIVAFTIVFCGLLISANESFGFGQPNVAVQVTNITHSKDPKIFYTNDSRNCGAHKSQTQPDSGGCYNPATPNILYVSTNLNFAETKYIVLHELGHYEQYKNDKAFSECGADTFAKKHGADTTLSIYYTKCNQNK